MKKPSNQKGTNTDYQDVRHEKKVDFFSEYIIPDNKPKICPVRDIFSPVSDKWSVLIIGSLGKYGVMRFGELKKLIYGISSKVLSERLKRLQRDGYIERNLFAEVPIRVEYKLTSLGFSYMKQLINIGNWIEENTSIILKNRKKFDTDLKS